MFYDLHGECRWSMTEEIFLYIDNLDTEKSTHENQKTHNALNNKNKVTTNKQAKEKKTTK